MATDSMFLMSLWPSGEMRVQWSPPSSERNTPSSAPATSSFEFEGAIAKERIDLPFMPLNDSNDLPPLCERNSSPYSCSMLHAATYIFRGSLGSKTM